MIKSELVDGFKGDGHVEVEQLGDINIGTYGPDDYVLETGKQLQAQVITNNKVRIFDGVMVIQGRRDVIAANAYTDVQIDNGAQGVKRNDIIVRRYTKDSASEIENTKFVVIKGTPGATATDPAVAIGNIRNGDTLHNMKLYRVRIEGLNIVGVDKLYKTNMSLSTLNSNLEANSYEDLTHLLSTGYGWTVDRLKCIRQGRLIHLSFFCYASSWTDNKRYIVLNPASGFAEYTPNYITYAVALAYNGDGTGAEPALFDVTDDGHVEICTSSTNRKYYACNMTWTF